MEKHRQVNHKDKDGHWSPGRLSRAQDRVVHCQRFYHVGTSSHFFEVTPLLARNRRALPVAPLLTPAELIRARVDQALLAGEAAAEVEDSQVPALATHPTKVLPWLELTRWPEYLRGQDLTAVALLGCLANQDTEPLLVQFSSSVQRLVSQAYDAIQSGQINEFDQVQIGVNP
jgi:hypothetical protein